MHAAPVNPFQKRRELGRAQLYCPIARVRPDEASTMKAFIEKAHPIRVVPQQFYPVTAPASKDEELSGEWIGRQSRLHQRCESVDPAAHIREACHQPDPYACRQTQHGRDNSRISTRNASACTWPHTFTRWPLENWISMQPAGSGLLSQPF